MRGAGPLITSQHPWLQPGQPGHTGDLETLCSAQDLRNVSLKPGHWHHSVVGRCHTPTYLPFNCHVTQYTGWNALDYMLTVLKGRDINERCVSESEPSNLVAPDICFTDERDN